MEERGASTTPLVVRPTCGDAEDNKLALRVELQDFGDITSNRAGFMAATAEAGDL